MGNTAEESSKHWDASLGGIRDAGDRLMSFSGLRYEGRYVTAGEFERVHVMEFGDGPPVLLVHGAGSGGPAWHRQIAALAEDHRVIVPDVPMFGLSDMPARIYAPREQIADVILGVMEQLEIDETDIAGHSMGAVGSLGALIREPERFRRAVLMSSPGFGRGLNWLPRLASVPIMRPLVRYGSRSDRYFFFDQFEAQKSGPSDEREAFKEMHFQVGCRNGATASFHEGLRSFAGFWGQREILEDDDLSKVRASVLLIWGDSDRIVPSRHSRRAVATIPDARLEVIEDSGHVVQLEAGERVTELVVDWFGVS